LTARLDDALNHNGSDIVPITAHSSTATPTPTTTTTTTTTQTSSGVGNMSTIALDVDAKSEEVPTGDTCTIKTNEDGGSKRMVSDSQAVGLLTMIHSVSSCLPID
jgi:hypothetical protein